MNLNISFKHIESEELIKTFIQEKSQTLKRYFDGRITVAWTLSSEKQNRIAHCHLVGNEMDYFGEGSTNDLKASIGMALDKIEKQLRKHKEIVKDHLHKSRLPTS
jgi:putative sigma-54 modulation protein